MKTRLCIFLLTACLAAYAQGRSSGPPSGGQMGGPPSGGPMGRPQSGPGSMGQGAGTMDAAHGNDHSMGNASRPADMGSQSPDILSRNMKLSNKLDSLLPKGMTAQQACTGFKNLGQCVAAIHVSNNLGISFDDLKAKTAGAHSENLGKAIHDLKPDVDAKAESKKAQKQADQDLREG